LNIKTENIINMNRDSSISRVNHSVGEVPEQVLHSQLLKAVD